MTEKKITYALSRIRQSKVDKYPLEALLKTYQLNVNLLKFIIAKAAPNYKFEDKKVKDIVKEFQKETENNLALKSIINKRSIKSLKPWLLKMDGFFKGLKSGSADGVTLLQNESEKICGILKISANKLFVKN